VFGTVNLVGRGSEGLCVRFWGVFTFTPALTMLITVDALGGPTEAAWSPVL